MIPHQAVCIDTISAYFLILTKRLNKPSVIILIFKYILPVYTPHHYVINTGCTFLSRLSCQKIHPSPKNILELECCQQPRPLVTSTSSIHQ